VSVIKVKFVENVSSDVKISELYLMYLFIICKFLLVELCEYNIHHWCITMSHIYHKISCQRGHAYYWPA